MHLESKTAGGILEDVDGQTFLRFERRFAHPVERVWTAITQPEQLAKWFCGTSEVELELVEGGAFDFRITGPPDLLEMIGEGDPKGRWTVLRVDPPRVFEHSFTDDPGSYTRYELRPDGDGCRLFVTVAVPSRELAIEGQFLVGWHMSLEALDHVLDGRPAPWTRARWEELADRYAAGG